MDEKNISFHPDAGLMYLIQQVTNKPTDEILGFFYDFGKEIFRIGVENMKTNQRSIRKDIQDIFPGTDIPFKVFVEGQRHSWSSEPLKVSGQINVTFPDNPVYMDTSKLMDIIMEKELLGGSSLPPFEKPPSRTPKMYKQLIESVIKGKKKE